MFAILKRLRNSPNKSLTNINEFIVYGQRYMYPYTCCHYPGVQNFTPFRFTANSTSRFTDNFETSALNDPKKNLKKKKARSEVPHIHVATTPTPTPQMSLFPSVASRFRVTGHFETCAPNDPKRTLGAKRSRYIPDIHVTTTPKSQLSLRFALWPPTFE